MRGAIVLLAGLALAAPATAAPPVVTASASPSSGAAPLRVRLSAAGDTATYAWSLGDGTTAAGPLITHVYPTGHFTATVTATGGCVRIPMWIAPTLFGTHGQGTTVVVHQ